MVWRFALTLFTSATLLFACQPMVARMLVPLMGGAPAVWIVCSLCFQALVLGGYFYAHVVSKRLSVRGQVIAQLALLASAFFVLPVVVDERLVSSLTNTSRSLGLIVVLLRSVGLPFFVLSTTSPLLQRWYAESGETDPYHLYSASNLGSMVALLGYPFAIEPFLSHAAQSRVHHAAFAAYAILVVICAITTLRRGASKHIDATPAPATVPAPEDVVVETKVSLEPPPASPSKLWEERALWLGLAFAPSSLLLGATEVITTDIASIPLLWVVPLALYLASFIIVFAKKQIVTLPFASRALALVATLTALSRLVNVVEPAWLVMIPHLLLLFAAAVVCHGALAARRPHHSRLTEFYLVMSLGGVLGGAFNGLVAPIVFDDLLEYPIAIGLVCLARATVGEKNGDSWRRETTAALALVAATFLFMQVGKSLQLGPHRSWFVFVPAVFVAFAWSRRPIRFAVAVAGMLLVGALSGDNAGSVTIRRDRDFFGALKVRRNAEGTFLFLISGNTVHGAQSLDPAKKRTPLSYYHPTGPAGDVLGAPRDVAQRVGVIGLGVGALAAYAKPADVWTFFELNPLVVDIAQKHFSFLRDVPSTATVKVETGDARLRLREGAPARFDVLVLDAFSSDAVPTHLVTREALAIYRQALAPGGALLAHVSNRHIVLEPVFAALAADIEWLALGWNDTQTENGEQKASSHWVVLSNDKDKLDAIVARNGKWRWLPPPSRQVVWTDDFANLLGAMRF